MGWSTTDSGYVSFGFRFASQHGCFLTVSSYPIEMPLTMYFNGVIWRCGRIWLQPSHLLLQSLQAVSFFGSADLQLQDLT